MVIALVQTFMRPFRPMPKMPLLGIDPLGMLLWTIFILSAIFTVNYGEEYNWISDRRIRIAYSITLALILHAQTTMDLQELYALADQQSRQINICQIGLIAAGEAVTTAKRAMLPNINFELNGSYIGNASLMNRRFSTSGTTDVIIAGLGPQPVANGQQNTPHWGNTFSAQASQIIYAGGAISAGIRLAELGEQMALLDLEKNRQEIRFFLAGYYLDLYKLHNQLEAVNKNIALTSKLIQNMEARHKQGTALKNDITRYELQIKNLELTKVKLQDAVAIINLQLTSILHLPETTVIQPDTLSLKSECQSLETIASCNAWLQTATENNIGLKQASIASDMAEQKIKTTQAASQPLAALVVENNLFEPFTNDLIPTNANVNIWFVGISVKYKLSSLWKNKHQINKARLDSKQSKEQVTLARESVENGIHANHVNFLTASSEISTQEKQVELAEQNYDIVQNRYQNGLALLTDMLDASNTKLSAEMALINARVTLLYSHYKLKYMANTL